MSTDQAALILYRLDELKGDIGQLSKRFDKVEKKVDQNRIDTASLKIKWPVGRNERRNPRRGRSHLLAAEGLRR